jgi:hypothetical protein
MIPRKYPSSIGGGGGGGFKTLEGKLYFNKAHPSSFTPHSNFSISYFPTNTSLIFTYDLTNTWVKAWLECQNGKFFKIFNVPLNWTCP